MRVTIEKVNNGFVLSVEAPVRTFAQKSAPALKEYLTGVKEMIAKLQEQKEAQAKREKEFFEKQMETPPPTGEMQAENAYPLFGNVMPPDDTPRFDTTGFMLEIGTKVVASLMKAQEEKQGGIYVFATQEEAIAKANEILEQQKNIS